MSLKYQLLLLLYVLPLAGTCQSPGSCTTHNYQKIYSTTESSEILDLAETSDGGRIAVGYIGQVVNSFLSNSKALVMKLDNAGNLQWAKGIKALLGNYFKKVRQTTDGGLYSGRCNQTSRAGDWPYTNDKIRPIRWNPMVKKYG